jgi:GTP-binding protein
MAHRYKEYQPYKGEINRRINGSLVALEGGTAFAYALDKLQDRGKLLHLPAGRSLCRTSCRRAQQRQ